jgi:lipopolysaccharide assembly outer membrane protein LptD (OstA)
MVVEDVPIPILGLPFGFFPSSNKRGAGVIIPMYGEEKNRGFFLRGGGWYQPLGQYLDMTLLADVYSKGSWAVHWGSDYKVRYRFNGNMKIDYAANRDNSNNSFPESEDFKWTWMHRQDPKANPTQNLSATVNFSSSNLTAITLTMPIRL